jgi:hypothetical protein
MCVLLGKVESGNVVSSSEELSGEFTYVTYIVELCGGCRWVQLLLPVSVGIVLLIRGWSCCLPIWTRSGLEPDGINTDVDVRYLYGCNEPDFCMLKYIVWIHVLVCCTCFCEVLYAELLQGVVRHGVRLFELRKLMLHSRRENKTVSV